MPTSHEGFEYTRYLFKPIDPSMTGGCHADVWMPPGNDKVGVAISYHGGGFTVCDSQHVFTGHVEYLLKHGFAVVSLEYRMAPHVRFPEIREDLVDGYRWVLEELPKIEPRVESDRNFVMGGSAGGYSALILPVDAMKAGLPLPKALYSAYPLTDLDIPTWSLDPSKMYTYDHLMATATPEQNKMFDALFAEPVTTEHHRRAEDPKNPSPREAWFRFTVDNGALNSFLAGEPGPTYAHTHAPRYNLSKDFPPTCLVLAGADLLLDPVQTRVVAEKLQELGVEVLLLEADDMPHGAIEPNVDGMHKWWDSICVPALEFCVSKCK